MIELEQDLPSKRCRPGTHSAVGVPLRMKLPKDALGFRRCYTPHWWRLAHTDSLARTYEVWLCCLQEGAAPIDKGLDVIHV